MRDVDLAGLDLVAPSGYFTDYRHWYCVRLNHQSLIGKFQLLPPISRIFISRHKMTYALNLGSAQVY